MKLQLLAIILSTSIMVSGLFIPQPSSCRLYPEGFRGYDCLEHSCYVWSKMLIIELDTLTIRQYDRQELKLLCKKYPDVLQMPNAEVVEKYLNFPYRLAGDVHFGLLGSDQQYTPGIVPTGEPGTTHWPFDNPKNGTAKEHWDFNKSLTEKN